MATAGGGAGWSATSTGSGENRGGALASGSVIPLRARPTSTGTLCGTNPGKVNVTVKSLPAGSCREHGVRQVGPSDVRASAPGGSESNCNALPLGARDPPLVIHDVSKLGIQDGDAQPVRTRAQPRKAMRREIIWSISVSTAG